MVEILEPEMVEASFRMEDEQGGDWWFHLAKLGGGTVGKEYTGDWVFLADEQKGQRRTVSGQFTTVIPKSHLGAAMIGWQAFTDAPLD